MVGAHRAGEDGIAIGFNGNMVSLVLKVETLDELIWHVWFRLLSPYSAACVAAISNARAAMYNMVLNLGQQDNNVVQGSAAGLPCLYNGWMMETKSQSSVGVLVVRRAIGK